MTALIVGRFQPFHNGHLKVIKEVAKKEDFIIICIGSAQYSFTLENPFTAGERFEMIYRTLKAEKIENFCIIPVEDLNKHSLWVQHVVSLTPKFDVVYTNEPLTRSLFEAQGFKTKRLPFYRRKFCSATKIRRRMIDGREWKSLVPAEVAKIIESIHGVERLQLLAKKDWS